MTRLLRTLVDLNVFAEVHAQKLRRTFAHLALLVLIASASATVVVAMRVGDLIDRLLPEIDKLPTVVIRDGEASADVPQPWVKRLGETQDGMQLVVIIDTTGTLEDFADDQVGLFLKKRHLRVKGDERRVASISLRRLGDHVIGPQLLRKWVSRGRWLLPALFFLIAFVWYWLTKSFQALVLTLVALIASSRRRRPLAFGSLFTVGVYALSPAVLMAAILGIAPIHIPYFALLYLVTCIVYTVLAVRKIPDDPHLTLV